MYVGRALRLLAIGGPTVSIVAFLCSERACIRPDEDAHNHGIFVLGTRVRAWLGSTPSIWIPNRRGVPFVRIYCDEVHRTRFIGENP